MSSTLRTPRTPTLVPAAMALLIAAVATVTAPSAIYGQEFQVNTATADWQYYPSVSYAPDGSFVVVWGNWDTDGVPGMRNGISGQRFAADGSKIGGELAFPGTTEQEPHLSHGADGSFVIGWYVGLNDGARGQLFDADGSARGDELIITPEAAEYPRFVHLPNDEFVAVTPGVEAQTFDGDGMLQAPAALLDGPGNGFAHRPDVTPLPGNRSIVLWTQTAGSDGDGPGIFGAVLDASGGRIGSEFAVNTYTTSNQNRVRVDSSSSGAIVAVWGSGTDEIRGRRLDASGQFIGDDFQINSLTSSFRGGPDVAVAEDGSFLVAWMSGNSAGTDQDSTSIQARRFASDGTPWEDEFQVNITTTGSALTPAVAARSNGDVMIVWASGDSPGDDTDETSILGRSDFSLQALHRDGFESGNLDAWSASEEHSDSEN